MDGPSQTLSDSIQNSRHLEATSSMTISRFYQHVLSRRASASAVDKICFLGMYQEVRFTIKHTYILLGVQPSHGQLFFLRLDRAAGQDRNLWLRLRSVSSKFPPNDRVLMSCNEEPLHTPPKKVLSHVTFQRDSPCLGDLATLLRIMEQESTTYTLYPENCWFFCSVVQESLTRSFLHSGSMNSAFNSLCPTVRGIIATRWATERHLRG